jgi:hypothetical protein
MKLETEHKFGIAGVIVGLLLGWYYVKYYVLASSTGDGTGDGTETGDGTTGGGGGGGTVLPDGTVIPPDVIVSPDVIVVDNRGGRYISEADAHLYNPNPYPNGTKPVNPNSGGGGLGLGDGGGGGLGDGGNKLVNPNNPPLNLFGNTGIGVTPVKNNLNTITVPKNNSYKPTNTITPVKNKVPTGLRLVNVNTSGIGNTNPMNGFDGYKTGALKLNLALPIKGDGYEEGSNAVGSFNPLRDRMGFKIGDRTVVINPNGAIYYVIHGSIGTPTINWSATPVSTPGGGVVRLPFNYKLFIAQIKAANINNIPHYFVRGGSGGSSWWVLASDVAKV